MSRLSDAVASGDLDRLIGLVDDLTGEKAWEDLHTLISLCEHATEERGIQLWPAAEYAEYRMALEAPGEEAGMFVVDGAGRNALGPLWEVAASTHTWSDLADHIEPGPARGLAAHERVVRGEELGSEDVGEVLEVPPKLLDWEPQYPVATYGTDKAEFPAPDLLALGLHELGPPGELVDDDLTTDALASLARPWAEHSNGSVDVVCVEGDAAEAIAHLASVQQVRMAEIDHRLALAWMAWAGASGGAYARRRGTPLGRASAWWVAASAADVEIEDPAAMGEAVRALRWFAWAPGELGDGWHLYLAVQDDDSGLAWAVAAVDSHREGDDPLSDEG